MRSRLLLSSLFISFLWLSSCKTASYPVDSKAEITTPKISDHTIQTVLWMQTSAEYRALSYQAFNIAKIRLDALLAEKGDQGMPPAIITDIDETVMDNSPSSANNIIQNEAYSDEEWAQWVQSEKAKEVPGAAEFLNYAKRKGVEVFYISNRNTEATAATIRNMKKINFPYADAKHVMMRTATSSKKERFDKVRQNYDVLLYMGDNLSDFSHKFAAPSIKERYKLADELQKEFGNRFIVLPNPIYGDWENKAIFKDRYDWTPQQKDSIRRAHLKAY